MKSKDELRGIYLIERLEVSSEDPKKYYIGQALDIFKRLNQHCFSKNRGIDEAITKYGVDKFSFRILEIVKAKEDLNACESKWIKTFIEKYGEDYLYNIAQTNNPRNTLDSGIRQEITELFKEDIGRSIYSIAEYYNISYDKIIEIRKPLLKEKGLKWIRGKIVDIRTKQEPENWRGYQFTKKLAEKILNELKQEGISEKDIRYVSYSDLQIFLNTMDSYKFAPQFLKNDNY